MKNNGMKRKSVIATAFRSFSDWLYSMANGGVFGKIFTSYSKVNTAFKQSASVAFVGNGSAAASIIRRVRFKISSLFEQSAFLHLWKRALSFIIGCRMRFFGSFTLVFGIYTALIYLVKRFAFSSNYADTSYLIWAFVLALVALPMLSSKNTLAKTLAESRTGHFVVTHILGIPEEKLEVLPSRHGDSYNLAIFGGLIMGTLTYFIPPEEIVFFIAVATVAALVLSTPEVGVVFVAFLLPFFGLSAQGGDALRFLVSLYSIGYFIKLLRGKRILSVEIYDLVLLIFGGVIAFGGIVSVGGEASAQTAFYMMYLLVGCFVALNLLRTSKWIKRCAVALFSSAFFVSLVMLWQLVARYAKIGFDLSLFAQGTNPFFETREALSAYLLLAFAIGISVLPTLNQKRSKFATFLGILCILGSIIAIGCKSAIVGAGATVLVHFIITRRRTVPVLLLSAAGSVYACFMLPARFLHGLMDFFESMLYYFWRAVSVWQGTLGIIVASLFGGVGVDAFSSVYPRFSLAGSEKATETSSLALRILCDVGLVGIAVFAIVFILFCQNCLEYIRNTKDKSKLTVAAGFSGIIGILFQSVFFDIWSNTTVFYAFWLVMAITVARIRFGIGEAQRSMETEPQSDSRASVDLF